MKKILLSFDGTHYSKGAFDFARRLNEEEPILLTAAFLPQIDFATTWSYANGGGSLFIPLVEGVDADTVNENIARFEHDCIQYDIEFRIHKDLDSLARPELRKESRYADLMILGSERFYENLGYISPNEYLRDALHDAECPVIVAPETFNYPESVILAYDGSHSSVYAIKNFAYLFPEFCKMPTTLVYAERTPGTGIPDEEYIKELAARHFSNLTLYQLESSPEDDFSAWMTGSKNPILVSGAFGRSGFSQIFKQSFAADIISEHRFPVFIAHR
jgi:nucleotide-binding universal stress UspA family protein